MHGYPELPATLHLVESCETRRVMVVDLNPNRAYVRDLGVAARPGSPVELSLEDEWGTLTLEGRLDWVAARSGVRFTSPGPVVLHRLHRLIRRRFPSGPPRTSHLPMTPMRPDSDPPSSGSMGVPL